MAAWRPLKRREFIRKLRVLGFDGPFSGTRHQFLLWQQHRQTIPVVRNAADRKRQKRMLRPNVGARPRGRQLNTVD